MVLTQMWLIVAPGNHPIAEFASVYVCVCAHERVREREKCICVCVSKVYTCTCTCTCVYQVHVYTLKVTSNFKNYINCVLIYAFYDLYRTF